MRAKNINLLEENISVIIHDLELDNGFSDMTLKAQATKEKYWTSTKLKSFMLQRIPF